MELPSEAFFLFKVESGSCRLPELMAGEGGLHLGESELHALLLLYRNIGRCPEQVEAFLKTVMPLLVGV